ncbi:MAG: hypothetical protein QM679_12440 [Patulibacter sp.]
MIVSCKRWGGRQLRLGLECGERAQMWAAIVVAALAVTAGATAGYAVNRANTVASQARDSARELCDRAIRFGVLNTEEHRRAGVYSPSDIRDFIDTIPKSCHPPDDR